LYQNCSLILRFHLLIPGPKNKISTKNRQSKSVLYSGRKRFCRRFRVFCLLSVKVCSWYKTHSKTGNLAGVRYVSILSVPGIQFRPVTVSFEAFSGNKMIIVGFTILNNLKRDRGFDSDCITNGRVESLVEYTLRRLRSKILYLIPRRHGEKR